MQIENTSLHGSIQADNDHCNRMSPLLFECIVFLKINKRFWGVA